MLLGKKLSLRRNRTGQLATGLELFMISHIVTPLVGPDKCRSDNTQARFEPAELEIPLTAQKVGPAS